jgi:GT2 family glycosyltransferase
MKWSLVIATYNRPEALRRCVKLAINQSRPPAEVVIVDASDGWEFERSKILRAIAPSATAAIRWCYKPAVVRSLTSQRNQAIALATGDVLFLIDDDSFMWPDCAEEVLKVYEADMRRCVAGVAPVAHDLPPESSSRCDSTEAKTRYWRALAQQLSVLLDREMYVERLLLPYDAAYPDHPIPPELAGMPVGATRYFNGFRMTFRASSIREVGFDETLRRYAAGEDLDASYRASRRGVLLNAFKARIFHAQVPQARLSRHTSTLLGILNIAYLLRCKGYNSTRLLSSFQWRVLRRLVVDVARDASRKRFSFPCARADLKALSHLRDIARTSDQEITNWYVALQERIIEHNAA